MRETASGISTLQKKPESFWILLMVLCGRLFGRVRIRPTKASEFFSSNFWASKCEQNSFIGGSKGGSPGTPSGSKFFHSHAVFCTKKSQMIPTCELAPPVRKTLDLPLILNYICFPFLRLQVVS